MKKKTRGQAKDGLESPESAGTRPTKRRKLRRSNARHPNRHLLTVERLEARRLLAASLGTNETANEPTLQPIAALEHIATESRQVIQAGEIVRFGDTIADNGLLIVNGELSAPSLIVSHGGELGGGGRISAPVTIESGGTASPGNSPGILNTGDFSLTAGSTLEVEIGGLAVNPGVDYDQVNATGTVTLGGTLDTTLYSNITSGEEYVIINNDGTDAVVGTFAGLPQNSIVSIGGATFEIRYDGDSANPGAFGGNDVVLIANNSTTFNKFWEGGGGNDNFSNASNWRGGVVPIATDDVLIDLVDDNTVNLDSAVTINSLQANDPIHFNAGVTTTDGQDYASTLTLSANTSLSGSDLRFRGAINGAFDLDVTASNLAFFIDTIGSSTPLSNLSVNAAVADFVEDITLSAGFEISAVNRIDVRGNVSIASGIGSVQLSSEQAIEIHPTASITTDDGDITLSANQQATASTGNFVGVTIAGPITTSGGDISISGKGGDSSGSSPKNRGVLIQNTISSTYMGANSTVVTISGQGVGFESAGVTFLASGSVETSNADISVTASAAQEHGLEMAGGVIRSLGTGINAGTITIDGTAAGSGGKSGLYLDSGPTIDSIDGDISITGNTSDFMGVLMNSTARIESLGTSADAATITIDASGPNTGFTMQESSQVRSVAGDIQIDGDGSHGIIVQGSAQVVSSGSGGLAASINLEGLGTTGQGIRLSNSGVRILTTDGAINIDGQATSATGFQMDDDSQVMTTSGAIEVVAGGPNPAIDIATGSTIDHGSGGTTLRVFSLGRVSGSIDGSGPLTVNNGNITFDGASTFTGGTSIASGATARLFTGSGLGTGDITVSAAGFLSLNNDITVSNDLDLLGASGTGSLASTSGANTYAGEITLVGSSGILVNPSSSLVVSGDVQLGAQTFSLNANGPLELAGSISGSGGLNIQSADEVTISSLNSFTGDTNVVSGRLSGTGTLDGPVNIQTGAELAPGNSPGILNTGDLNLQSGGTLEIEIGGTTPGNGSSNHDQINVTGTVTLAGELTALKFNGFRPTTGQEFVIINNDGSDSVSGTFNGLAEGQSFSDDDVTYTVSYVGGDGNDVVLTAESNTIRVTNLNGSGAGSLYQAVLDANNLSGVDRIAFDVAGPLIVNSASPLPTITEAIHIDARTAPGYSGSPVFELQGEFAGTVSGLDFAATAEGSSVRGLSITAFLQHGIRIASNDTTIEDNWIGLDLNGNADGNALDGIRVNSASPLIRGNVISANSSEGIEVIGSGGGIDESAAFWLKGENDFVDASGQDNDGSSIGGVGFATGVGGGQAFAFDGIDDFVEVLDTNDTLDVGTTFTIEAWFNTNDPFNASSQPILMHGFDNVDGQNTALVVRSDGRLEMNVRGTGIGFENITGSTVLNANTWYHAAFTYDGSVGTLYLDGALEASDTTTIDLSNNSRVLVGGYQNPANSNFLYFDGEIDEPAIYGRVLNATEIGGIHALDGAGKQGAIVEDNVVGLNADSSADRGNASTGVLFINSSANVVSGNVISGNNFDGLGVANSHFNTIQSNRIGSDDSGTIDFGNTRQGVLINQGSVGNLVGGLLASQANVISGNDLDGIQIADVGTSGNRVEGNLIGVNITGQAALPNSRLGALVNFGATDNTFGGVGPGAGNVISGNLSFGIQVADPGTSNNVVAGNFIGTNSDGTNAIANSFSGVFLSGGATGNTIGGGSIGSRNIISGNANWGVALSGNGTEMNVVSGNFIGTDANGTSGIANGFDGVLIQAGASNNVIGSDGDGQNDTNERNIVSGNAFTGLRLTGTGTTGNQLAGNFVGVDVTGNVALTNGAIGVWIEAGASSNTVGGNKAELRNIISGNSDWGVYIEDAGTESNVVAGNFIGTNVTGTSAIANSSGGVLIINAASDNLIGTDGDGVRDAEERNIISGNIGRGIIIASSGTTGNRVAGNYIGMDVTGGNPLGNTDVGIVLQSGASQNIIGTNSTGDIFDFNEGNVISGNTGFTGVAAFSESTNENVIAGNIIGLNADGDTSFQNNGHGIAILDGPDFTQIGTDGDGIADEAERNVVSGNRFSNVLVQGVNTFDTFIAGNYVGTDATGSFKFATGGGVEVRFGAQSTRIGTDGSVGPEDSFDPNNVNERNVISGSNGAGVIIKTPQFDGTLPANGQTTNNTVVAGNYIGVAADGVTALENRFSGILVEGAVGTRIGTDGDGAADIEERNIISGNRTHGIQSNGSIQTTVAGNYIGTDFTGTASVGNVREGIFANGNTDFLLVGTDGDNQSDEAERNIISGNSGSGILLPAATNTIIAGNFLGTDVTGTSSISNSFNGIRLLASTSNTRIGTDGNGTADLAERNLISGNNTFGIISVGASQTTIAGNLIGTDITGLGPIGNGRNGIELQSGTSNTVIGTDGVGGNDAVKRNIISANNDHGIFVGGSSVNATIAGNFIGTNIHGDAALGNNKNGVFLGNTTSTIVGTNGDGTADQNERNVISGNGLDGVFVNGSSTGSNTVAGNFVGTNATGSSALPNSQNGIQIAGSSFSNTIGGDLAVEANVISGNVENGVLISGTSTQLNQVVGNFIGVDASGQGQIPGTVSLYPFDGTTSDVAGVVDASVVGIEAFAPGKTGQAFSFDGSTQVTIDDPIFSNQGGSLEFWFNASALNGSGTVLTGNYTGTGQQRAPTFLIDPFGGLSWEFGSLTSENTSVQVATNTWYHVALTYDSGFNVNVYVNGARVGGGVSTDPGSFPSQVVVGDYGAASTFNPFSGRIDDLGFYDRPLTQNEIDDVVIRGNNGEGKRQSLGNGSDGVEIDGAPNNTIGGADSLGNIISGNSERGVYLTSGGATGNVIAGNLIGTDATGNIAVPNSGGVLVSLSGGQNKVGIAGAGNIVSGNEGSGITIDGSGFGNIVSANWIGIGADGITHLPNTKGVTLNNVSGQVIGTDSDLVDDLLEGNVISGNSNLGVEIAGNSQANVLAGNLIGLLPDGFTASVGQGTGVLLSGNAQNNTIGGDSVEERNVISGNTGSGVRMTGSGVSQNTVSGNYIGTDSDGALPVGNSVGVWLSGSTSNNVIGGDSPSERNVISGNGGDGILIRDTGTTGNVVSGNFVGVDFTGNVAFANGGSGIQILDAPNNLIGVGVSATNPLGERNVISGNGFNGILITGPGAVANTIAGNNVGTDAMGQGAVGNQQDGIRIENGSSDTQIGGWSSDLRNVISGNADTGIYLIDSGTSGTTIEGNFIGTNATGAGPIANRQFGIVATVGSENVQIGGGRDASTTSFIEGPGNVISGNAIFGIAFTNVGGDSKIQGNRIGTNLSGAAAIPNGTRDLNTLEGGIRVGGLGVPIIVGTDGDENLDATEGNLISGNSGAGIQIRNVTGGHRVSGNLIGVNATANQELGNQGDGVQVIGSSSNLIGADLDGKSDDLEGNIIGGNLLSGISLNDPSLNDGVTIAGNAIRGNLIGTDPTGTNDLGNGTSGIQVLNVASTVIGDVAPFGGNTIAYSGTQGIRVTGDTDNESTAEISTLIAGNRYVSNETLAINLGSDTQTTTPAVTLNEEDDGIVDFPVIDTATIDAGELTITGWVGSGRSFDLFVATPELGIYSDWGEGNTRLANFTEGSVDDADATSSTYGPSVNGLAVATSAITQNRFEFKIPVSSDVDLGSLVTAVVVGQASEFSPLVFVGEQQSQLAPEIDAGEDFTLTPGERFQRVGTFFDPDSTNWTGTVNYGDGTGTQALVIAPDNSFVLDHVYNDSGSFNVTVTVTDASITTGSAEFTVTVANEAPEISVGNLSLTSQIQEGQVVTLTGSFGDSGLGDTHKLDIDWGDGTIDVDVDVANGSRDFTATHVYENQTSEGPTGSDDTVTTGIYRVTVTVRDQQNASDASPAGVLLAEVQNALPTNFVPTFSSTSLIEGQQIIVGGSFLDPGSLDTHTVLVDWGDRSPVTRLNLDAGVASFAGLEHRYVDDPSDGADEYTLRIELIDDDEPLAPIVFEQLVQVANDVPSGTQLQLTPTSIDENGEVTLSGSFVDAGIDDRHTLRIDWGDESQQTIDLPVGSRTLPPVTHRYINNRTGGFTITAEVVDRDSPSEAIPVTATIDVINIKPILTGLTLSDTLLDEGQTLTVSGSFEDVGILDTHQVFVEWGDGTTSEASVDATNRTFTAEHFYRDNGTDPNFVAPLLVTVIDNEGAEDSQSQSITVNNVQPEVQIAPLSAILNPDGTPDTTKIPLSAELFDPGLDDTFVYNWSAEPLVTPSVAAQTGSGVNFTIDRTAFPNAAWRVSLTVQDDDMQPLNQFSSFSTVLLLGSEGPDTVVIDDQTFTDTQTSNILALGLGGEDVIDATGISDPNLSVVLDGGGGQDFLYGGQGNDTYYLRSGDDFANVSRVNSGGGTGSEVIELTLEDGTVVPVTLPAGTPQQVMTAGNDRYVLTPNSTLTVIDPDGANELDFSLADFDDNSGITFDLDLAISDTLALQDVSSSQPNTHFVVTQGNFSGLVGSEFDDQLTGASNTTLSGGAGKDTFAVKANTINATFAGGADDDVLQVFDTGIQDLNFSGDEGIDSLVNTGSIERLNFTGGADDDILQNNGEIKGELVFAGGADQDILINDGSIVELDFRGGADDDVLENRGTVTVELNFGGDEGIDVLTNVGAIEVLNFNGGADDDIFVNSGVDPIELDFRGGADDDILLDQPGSVGQLVFSGDDGSDIFTNLGTIDQLVFGGGADDDIFINAGPAVTQLNFGGDEDVLLSGNGLITNLRFSGDDGTDSLFNTGEVATLIFTGGADDDIFINNGPTVTELGFGPGADDDVLLRGAGVVGTLDFQGGADGDDVLVNLGVVTNINFTGGADDDILLNVGSERTTLNFGGDEDILLIGNADVQGTLTFSGDDGSDSLFNTGVVETLNFTGGADDDFLRNDGFVESGLVFGGDAGLDILQNTGTVIGELSFVGDLGLDVLVNDGQVESLVFTGGADDDILINGGERPLELNFGGDDDILVNKVGTVDDLVFRGDEGADSLLNLGIVDELRFTGGADDDILQNDGVVALQLNFGGDEGADSLINNGTAETLVFGGGADDDVLINRGVLTQNLEFGGDQDLSTNGLVDITADTGVDQLLNLGTVEGSLTFTGGADDDILQNDGFVVAEITFAGDEGIDILRNNGTASVLNFTGGADDDALLNLGRVDEIVFGGDDGVDSLINLADEVSRISFGGGADDDILQNDGAGLATLEFVGGADDDTLLNRGDSVERLIFDGGADDDVLINDGFEVGQLIFGGDLQPDSTIVPLANAGDDTLIIRGRGKSQGSRVYFNGDLGVDALQNNATGFGELIFDGGADDDALQNNAEEISNINFRGDDGSDIFENNGAGVTQVIFTGGADDDVFINDGSLASELTFLGGADDDVFINNGSATRDLIFNGDVGADVLANTGVDVVGLEFTGGADDDVLISDGPRLTNLTFNGDDGLDALLINQGSFGSSDLTFNGGADDDLLINDASEIARLTFVGDTGVDGLQNNGFQVESLTFEGGADDDVFISIGNRVSDLLFVGGADDDTLQVSGFEIEDLNFRGDDGEDVFLTNGQIENLTFTGGADDDVLQIASGIIQAVVFSGDTGVDTLVNGGDVVELTFNGGADDDVLQNNGNSESILRFNGGADNDVFISNGNEIAELIFSGDEGADTLINNAQSVGRLVFNGDIGADVLRIQTGAIEELEFNGGADSDALKYSGDSQTGRVTFNGEEGNDLLSWDGNALELTFDGGAGDDVGFVLGDGSLLFDGGEGNDLIKIIGNPNADLTVGESFAGTADASSDTIDFASFTGGALNLDLRSDSDQPQSSSFSIKVLDANGLENVVGTPGSDFIAGNTRNNIIFGADFAEPFDGPLVATRSDVQWVLLDFDTQTNRGELDDGTEDVGEFVYSLPARDEIEAGIEEAYRGPDTANPWFDVRVVQQLSDIPQAVQESEQFVTIFFNETPDFGRPGGLASEIDLGNQALDGTAQVQVNGLLGGILTANDIVDEGIGARVGTADGFGNHHDDDHHDDHDDDHHDDHHHGHDHGNMIGESYKSEFLAISDAEVGSNKPAATEENFIRLSTKIAAHELGHLLGLRHADSFGPIGFGLHDPPGGSGYKPAFTGPSGAFETFDHILGSPASVGSTRFDDLQDLFFGEREAIKLTYGFSDPTVTTVADSGTNLSQATSQPLQLVTAAVPNTLRRGVNADKEFFVQMLGVNGQIELENINGVESSTNDWYSFDGIAGELINLDVMSNSLARFGSDPDNFVDTIVNVWYEVNGQLELVPYYSGLATNDDIFEPTDSSIVDLILPTDATYFIEVDTFRRTPEDPSYDAAIEIRDELLERRDDADDSNDLSDAENNALERLIDTIEDQDVGQYQLFVFKYRDANIDDGIDTIKGNGGTDDIDGGPGDSFELIFSVGEDIGPIDEGQGISRNIQLLDRAATEWSLSTVDYGDGTGIQPLEVDSLGNFTLSHQYLDNGEFTVTVTIRNDIGAVQAQTFDVLVENVAPTIVANSDSTQVDEGQTAAVTGTFGDVGDDDLEVSADFGEIQFDTDTGQWSWSYDSTNELIRVVTITVMDDDGGSAFDTFDLTVDNVAPNVGVANSAVAINEGTVGSNSGEFSDAGNDTITITTNLGVVTQDNTNGTWSWSYEGIDDLSETVTITATDDAGLFQSTSFSLTVNNLAPIVESTNAAVVIDEGATATNTGTFGDVTADSVEITTNRGVVTQDNINGSWSWSYVGIDDFAGTVTITATDDDGTASSTTFDLTVDNVAPTGTLVAPTSADEGTAISVSLTNLVDASAIDASSLRFSFATDTASLATSYAEASDSASADLPLIDDGTATVFARVFDKDGGVNEYSSQVSVSNVDPTIEALTPFGFLLVGDNVQFVATATDLGINDSLDFQWQFGDGTVATGNSTQHTYTDAGVYEVTLTVNDGDGGSDVRTFEIDVIVPQESSTEGALFTKTVPFVGDASATWTATIDYGDGTQPETISVDPEVGILLNHIFEQDSSDQIDQVFSISIELNNDQGQQLATGFNASVINLRPSALDFSVSGAPVDGQILTFTGTAFDVPGDVLTYSWNFGDGTTASGQTAEHVYQVAGEFEVTLTVADDDESVEFIKPITIEIANQGAPIVSISAPVDGVRNDESTFVLSAFDPDGATEFTYVVNWGDGTNDTFVGQSPLEITHTYTTVATDGKFEISVTASDGELTGDAATAKFGVLGWSILPDPVNPGEQVLVVVGSEGNDSILVWDFWGDWFKVKIRDRTDHVRYRGLTNGDVASILVFGHGGNDRVDIGWSLLPATILGGSGNDLLRGGWGNDIILGNSGNDKLFGEWGRDILIGGTGADRIHGDQHDDILIAGFTAFDEEFNRLADRDQFSADRFLSFEGQRAALESIMAEWASDRNYHTRRHNLLGNTDNDRQNEFFLKHDESESVNNTVFDDDAVDTLWGNGGIDWFFASEEDRVRDKRRWEAEAELDRWWE